MSENKHQMAVDLLQAHLGLSEEEALKQLGMGDEDTRVDEHNAQFQASLGKVEE